MIDRSNVAWSCVIDDTPEIWSSIVPWLATAIELARIDPSQIHVHHVCVLRPEIEELCHTLRVNTHKIERFDPQYPHTNKIQQCTTAFTDARHVVLTDVDVVFACLPPLDEIQTPVAGKLVDLPNPPMEILREVFSASGVPFPRTCTNAYVDSENTRVEFETLLGNHNGGLLLIDREHLARIGHAWAYWARWLIAHIDLLDRWAIHVDQVSFCLAVNNLRMAIGLLEDAWNFPLHRNAAPSDIEPFILHHHAVFDNQLRLKQVSVPRAREAITRVNGAIESFQRRHFPGLIGLCAPSRATPTSDVRFP
jgi:hypothetical protein